MFTPKTRYINAGGNLLDLSTPKVMGILNVTPDSFYAASRCNTDEEIITSARKMIEDGAAIIDIGGYSSRPGAENVTVKEERIRVLKTARLISKEFPGTILSVDTFRSDVAKEAVLEGGVHIINDISGGDADKLMFEVVRELNVPYILMHMKGVPETMQENPVYDDVVTEILKWMGKKILELRSSGVKDIILDPGFGFGKTITHNFELLRHLSDFSVTDLPVLVGVSRKSMIWKTLSLSPEDALNGTTVLNTFALLNGADILRVHDVKEAVQAVKLVMRIMNADIES